jgi:hypothetical protein
MGCSEAESGAANGTFTGFSEGGVDAGGDTQAGSTESGDESSGATGNGDGATGDGDGATGDGDGGGESTTGDGDGDGGGESTTGDGTTGDGDGTSGDGDGTSGDGDGTSGDGDGTSGDGDGTSGDGDGTSGDGDGTSGDGDGDDCEAPATHMTCDSVAENPTPDQAVGLNCPGDQYDSTQTVAASFSSPDSNAWRIARQFGTSGDWVNTEGDQMLVISTYTVPAPDGTGMIDAGNEYYVTGGGNSNPDNQALPSPMSAANGGAPAFTGCDGVNDCSNSLQSQWQQGGSQANDLIWFDFSVDVPGGTYGWTMDFNFITAEYPNWVNTEYNDILVVWNSSEAYTGNVCFVGDEPCTVTALQDAIEDAANGGAIHTSPKMAGTGMKSSGGIFATPGGGATGWYQMQGQAVPDETLEITVALFDMGDTLWDTLVLLDNWRWDCEGCDPTIPGDCGVVPIPE